MAKLILGWGNKKYERKREKKWEENWRQWKHSSGQEILKRGLYYKTTPNPNISLAFKGLFTCIGLHNRLRIY